MSAKHFALGLAAPFALYSAVNLAGCAWLAGHPAVAPDLAKTAECVNSVLTTLSDGESPGQVLGELVQACGADALAVVADLHLFGGGKMGTKGGTLAVALHRPMLP